MHCSATVHCPCQIEDTLQSQLRGFGQKVFGRAENACAGAGDLRPGPGRCTPRPRSAARSRPLAGMRRNRVSPGSGRVRQCPGGRERPERRTPERTCCPGSARLPSHPPAALVLALRSPRGPIVARSRPRPPPGPLTPAHSSGAPLAGPSGAGGAEPRSEWICRRRSSAAPPARPQPALQSEMSITRVQRGHG